MASEQIDSKSPTIDAGGLSDAAAGGLHSRKAAKSRHILGECIKYFTLVAICVMSSSIRLFSVVKYESVIHEFDPYCEERMGFADLGQLIFTKSCQHVVQHFTADWLGVVQYAVNYRVTQFLSKEGFYSLWNWFDDRTWYPLGRVIGGTVYPVRLGMPASSTSAGTCGATRKQPISRMSLLRRRFIQLMSMNHSAIYLIGGGEGIHDCC
jgi:hypothetical protein